MTSEEVRTTEQNCPPRPSGALFARIARVMEKVRVLPEDGKNTYANYAYTTAQMAFERIGRAMAEEGLVVIPSIVDHETMSYGSGQGTRTVVRFVMTLADADGNTYEAPWIAEGLDKGNPDKALNKAATTAVKFFLLRLFLVGVGADDQDGEDHRHNAGPNHGQQEGGKKGSGKQQAASGSQNGRAAQSSSKPAQDSAELAAELEELCKKHYGANAAAKLAEIAHAASKGKSKDHRTLEPAALQGLIGGLRERMNTAA